MSGAINITHANGKIWLIPSHSVQCKVINSNKLNNLCLMFAGGEKSYLFVRAKNYKSMTISDELERAYCGGIGRLVEINPKDKEEQKKMKPNLLNYENLKSLKEKYERYKGEIWTSKDMDIKIKISEIGVELTNKGEFYFSICYQAPTGELLTAFGCVDEVKFRDILAEGIDKTKSIKKEKK